MKNESQNSIILIPESLHRDFESIKKVSDEGFEYWEARELMSVLGYVEWRKFMGSIQRSKRSCATTGQAVSDHFVGADKMIIIGKNTPKEAKRKVIDYRLSRFACYLIAQNGDPRKPEIAFAQTYFAIQTRKQEIFTELDADGKRIYVRQEVISHNKQLFETAKKGGVQNFGKFNDAGYLGLYGHRAKDIRALKQLGKDDILDRAGSTELAANLFRITQTDEKLRQDGLKGERHATETHQMVGRKVRKTIKEIGGIMPEHLPPEEHISSLIQKKIGYLPPKKEIRQIGKKNNPI